MDSLEMDGLGEQYSIEFAATDRYSSIVKYIAHRLPGRQIVTRSHSDRDNAR